MTAIDSPDYANTTADPTASDGSEIWQHVAILRHRWWLILLCVGLSLGFMYWNQRNDKPIYRAEASVQTKSERPPIDIGGATAAPNMVSEMEILRSSAVLGGAAERLDPGKPSTPDVIGSLRGHLTVTQVPGTNLMRIQFWSESRKYAADAANAIAESYQAFSARKATESATGRHTFISNQMAIVADSLAAAQQAMADYQARAGVLDAKNEGGNVAAQVSQAETEVRNFRYQESVAQTLSQSLRTGDDEDVYRQVSILGKDVIPGATDLYARLQQLATDRSRLTASRFGQTQSGPQVEVIDSLVRTTKREIRAVTDQTLALIRTRRVAAEQRLGQLQAEQGALPARANELSRLQQHADAVQKTFDMLAARNYEAQIADAMKAGQVEIVDRATVPNTPDPTNKRRRLIVGALAGLLLGIVLSYLMEFLNTRIRTGADAVKVTGLTMLGAIPMLSRDTEPDRKNSLVDQNATAGAEAFRMLRTALQFSKAERPQIIAVTSAGPGEGKSLIALNLAASISRQGSRVLLIDGDLRRPTVHNALTIRRSPGLSDVLVGEVALKDAVLENVTGALSVLPCGNASPSPAELLGSRRFVDLLAQLRSDYDQIIVDTPPVLAVTDATVLMPALDGVLLIVRSGKTDRYALGQTLMQLRHVHASVLGLVLNCAPPAGAYGAYGGHYGYYGNRYTEYYTNGKRVKATAGRG